MPPRYVREMTLAPGDPPGADRTDPTAGTLEVLGRAERTLGEIDHALARLADGTYGTCEACGAPITDDRLTVLPTARTCGAHPQLTDPGEAALA